MRKGQTIMEYIIIVGLVTVALFYMGPALKRSLQGMIKVTADQLGNQQQSDQDIVINPEITGAEEPGLDLSDSSGYLESSNTSMTMNSTKDVYEGRENLGQVTYNTTDRTETQASSLTNLGFTKE